VADEANKASKRFSNKGYKTKPTVYEKLLNKKKTASTEEAEKYEIHIKNFKNQFLYLLASLHKIVEQEKNAK